MPFVVVITAVVFVNNGDDNAWCFVSVLSFVVLPKQALLAEELLQQGTRGISHIQGCTLLL